MHIDDNLDVVLLSSKLEHAQKMFDKLANKYPKIAEIWLKEHENLLKKISTIS